MSETEHWKGTLHLIDSGSGAEEVAEIILSERGHEGTADEGSSALNQLLDYCRDEFVVVDGVLYEVERKKIDLGDEIYLAATRAGGRIDFEVQFYNGGCDFSEAIEEAVKRI